MAVRMLTDEDPVLPVPCFPHADISVQPVPTLVLDSRMDLDS